jgi:MarR family transcriptional regulator, negative regulator of the multidrug operon emrRAB
MHTGSEAGENGEGEAAAPGGEAAAPRGEAAAPRGEAAAPRGEAATPGGEAAAPDGEAAAPRAEAASPRGAAGSPRAEAPWPAAPRPGGGPARAANLLGAVALDAAGALEAATRPVVGQAGAAAAALVTIAAHPGRSIERLRAPLGLSQPGAVRLVERLVGLGWVERAGPGGRRGLELHLTPQGETVLDELLVARRQALAELLDPLTEAERGQLGDLLEKLLASRTGDRDDLERLCRLCDWRICDGCPVAGALR